jgi:hypothetical protein
MFERGVAGFRWSATVPGEATVRKTHLPGLLRAVTGRLVF